ncbi:methyl-accepting chemotaxis protein, partial [Goekera deserti]
MSVAPRPAPSDPGSAGHPGGISSRLGLRSRLLGAILVLAVVTVVVTGLGVARMAALSERADQAYSEGTVPLDTFRAIQVDWWVYVASTARSSLPGVPPQAVEAARQQAQGALASIDAGVARLQETELIPAADEQLERFITNRADYLTTFDAVRAAVAAGDVAARGSSIAALDGFQAETTDALVQAATVLGQHAAEATEAARSSFEAARTLTIAVAVVGLAAALVLALAVARSVIRPVEDIRTALDRVAAGDLAARVVVRRDDELGAVGRALNSTVQSLADVMRLVRSSAAGLAASSAAMAQTATAMSTNAEAAATQADRIFTSAGEVAMSVDTVAAGSSEMEGAIREISSNANQAATVARRAVEVAGATTTTVAKLGESSAEIAQVVKVITAIAEQTNLLALNATIE